MLFGIMNARAEEEISGRRVPCCLKGLVNLY